MGGRVRSRHGRRAACSTGGALLLLLLTACGGPVEVGEVELSGTDREACAAFAEDLPETLAEQERVEIEPADAPAAAYGDPPIVVRCGVGVPEGFDLTASCEIANGVGWYMPEEQYTDQDLDQTLTTAGYRPRVEIRVPAGYRPNAGAAAMAVLAEPVKEHLTLEDDCD
ncbi:MULTISPECIES: DUF3515 domain-containing protein [Nocardioides]|uniref:DUF3515 domain-containing protein n=1 Tax=Nocardioides vastitatis TaxID=2568655 RepID=A0ABW0ZJI5_9ACTN|nr:DUF3515 domain-containing protein [Nocardioides sp.]